jgi:hypothetical protein
MVDALGNESPPVTIPITLALEQLDPDQLLTVTLEVQGEDSPLPSTGESVFVRPRPMAVLANPGPGWRFSRTRHAVVDGAERRGL